MYNKQPKTLKNIREETIYLTKTEKSKTDSKQIFSNKVKIIKYLQGIVKSDLFATKHSFPKDCRDTQNLHALAFKLSKNNLCSITLEHGDNKDKNKITVSLKLTFHVSDTHGSFDASINAIRNCFDENGRLLKDIVIVNHGDILDRGEHSIKNLIFWLKLKKEYPDQIILLRGNHEFKDMWELYGQDWLDMFSDPSGTNEKTSHKPKPNNGTDKIKDVLTKIFTQFPIYDFNILPRKSTNSQNFKPSTCMSVHGAPQVSKPTDSFAKTCGSEANVYGYGDNPLWNEPTRNSELDGVDNHQRGSGCFIGRKTRETLFVNFGIEEIISGHCHLLSCEIFQGNDTHNTEQTIAKQTVIITANNLNDNYGTPRKIINSAVAINSVDGCEIYTTNNNNNIPTTDEIRNKIKKTNSNIDLYKPQIPQIKERFDEIKIKKTHNSLDFLYKTFILPMFNSYFLHAVKLKYNTDYNKQFCPQLFRPKNFNQTSQPEDKTAYATIAKRL